MKAVAEIGRTRTGAPSRWYQPRSLRGQLLAWLAPWVVRMRSRLLATCMRARHLSNCSRSTGNPSEISA